MTTVQALLAKDRRSLLAKLALQARSQAVFACSEIGKGIAVVGVGDMVVADVVGELVIILALMAMGAAHWRFGRG